MRTSITRKNDPTLEILIPPKTLHNRISKIAKVINKDYISKELTVIGILNGSFVFMADLIRQLKMPLTCGFMTVSSYYNSTNSNGVHLNSDMTQSIKGKNVLIVEDIIDTGSTAKYLINRFRRKKPKSVALCALLKKDTKSNGSIKIDYLGFTIPNKFVAGYGLDYKGKYRNLPYIAVAK